MSELETPPPISDIPPNPPPTPPEDTKKKGLWGGILTVLAVAATKLKTLATVGVSLLKIAPLAKFLTTGGSMFVTAWLYATQLGWPFAVGFVLCIFVHEMGHVYVAWRQGLPVSAPVFIPFMGAVVFSRRANSAWEQAIMGIGGPVGGAIAATVCWAVYAATGSQLMLGLAYVGFMINLFNLIPVLPLDGGWIVGSVEPKLWLAGLIGIIVMTCAGLIHNPLIFILIILSIPTLWKSLRGGGPVYAKDQTPPTPQQKLIMGACYLGLAAFLAFGMAETHKIGR